MDTPLYYLSKNAFVCHSDHHYIFLHLPSDRYICAEEHEFESLGPWLFGWDSGGPTRCLSNVIPYSVRQVAEQLIERDVLTLQQATGRPVVATTTCQATESFVDYPPKSRPSRVLSSVARFLLASRRANASLRKQRLQETIDSVRARKDRAQTKGKGFDTERAAFLVSQFNELRSYFPRNYLCLFDSLALIEFLAVHDLFPMWVFGVQANPFTAHCWVQQGALILNDPLEMTHRYTPVMAI